MKTFEVSVNIPENRRLMIELPEGVEAGDYQVVVIMTPAKVSMNSTSDNPHKLNELAGQVSSFSEVDAVAWQQQIRSEWDAS